MTWTRHRGRLALDRRTFLRGALAGAAVTVGLPTLGAMLDGGGDALASGVELPRRFGLFFWGNGNRPERWVPAQTGDGDAWAPSESLAPLAPWKHKLLVVSGTHLPFPVESPHGTGVSALLSGSRIADPVDHFSHQHATLDQVLARAIGGETLFRSVETGSLGAVGRSFTGPWQRAPATSDPLALWERLFGPTFRLPGEPADPKLALRRSALDAVMADFADLRQAVDAADRARLDQHLTGVRELELRLARLQQPPAATPTCARVPAPAGSSAHHDALFDLLAMALACDETRVFSHWHGDPENGALYPGQSVGHHQLTHEEPGDQPAVAAITLQIVGALAGLLERLDAIPEGHGTLLDRTGLLAASEVSSGREHSFADMPILVAGGAGGRVHVDRHLRAEGSSAIAVPLALLHAFDVPATGFGHDEGFVSEPLPGVLV